jgi:hypothetical protein
MHTSISSRLARRGRALPIVIAILGVLTVAGGLRVATLRADLPYTTIPEEPFALTGAAHQISERTWDPSLRASPSTKTHPYIYPSFLMDATAITATVIAAARGETEELREGTRATVSSPYIEVVEPRLLVLSGRLVVVALSLATVLLAALLGMRLAGPWVGVLAALFVAVLPIFVTRSSITTVDMPATCFATAAFYCAARVVSATWMRPFVSWVVAGAVVSAFAFTTKYSVGPVLLVVLAGVAFRSDRTVKQRMRVALVAAGVFVITAALVMPALVFRTSDVIDVYRFQVRAYRRFPGTDSYLEQLLHTRELGSLLLFAGLIGLALLWRSQQARPVVAGYVVVAILTLGSLVWTEYQPLRNLLPFVPFLAVAAATAIVGVVRFVGTRLKLPRGVQTAAAVVIGVALCVPPVSEGTRTYIDRKRDHTDTRVTLRRWIGPRVQPGERVLVAEELAFLHGELRHICAPVVVGSQREPAPVDSYDWVLVGDLDSDRWPSPWWDALDERRETRDIGRIPTSGPPSGRVVTQPLVDVWHRNDELIHVFGPDDASTRSPRRTSCAEEQRSLRDLDDIIPVVTPAHGSAHEGDAGPTEVRVPIELSRRAEGPVTITWRTVYDGDASGALAEPPGDYTPASGSLTVPEGETRAVAVITINGDTVPEPDESVIVVFGTDTNDVRIGGDLGVGRASIVDDDAQ